MSAVSDAKINALVAAGASRWAKGGHDRVYLNDVALKAVGLELAFYNTGNISAAEIDGEKISNCRAKKLVAALDGIFLDVPTDKLHWFGHLDPFYLSKIREFIDGLEEVKPDV